MHCYALLCFALLALLCFAFALLCFCFALLCFALLCFALLCFALLWVAGGTGGGGWVAGGRNTGGQIRLTRLSSACRVDRTPGISSTSCSRPPLLNPHTCVAKLGCRSRVPSAPGHTVPADTHGYGLYSSVRLANQPYKLSMATLGRAQSSDRASGGNGLSITVDTVGRTQSNVRPRKAATKSASGLQADMGCGAPRIWRSSSFLFGSVGIDGAGAVGGLGRIRPAIANDKASVAPVRHQNSVASSSSPSFCSMSSMPTQATLSYFQSSHSTWTAVPMSRITAGYCRPFHVANTLTPTLRFSAIGCCENGSSRYFYGGAIACES